MVRVAGWKLCMNKSFSPALLDKYGLPVILHADHMPIVFGGPAQGFIVLLLVVELPVLIIVIDDHFVRRIFISLGEAKHVYVAGSAFIATGKNGPLADIGLYACRLLLLVVEYRQCGRAHQVIGACAISIHILARSADHLLGRYTIILPRDGAHEIYVATGADKGFKSIGP